MTYKDNLYTNNERSSVKCIIQVDIACVCLLDRFVHPIRENLEAPRFNFVKRRSTSIQFCQK